MISAFKPVKKRINIPKIAIALALLLCVNWLGSLILWRVDLTGDKRYTLSPVTKTFVADKLQDDLEVEIYLDGSVNPAFHRLEQAVVGMMKQFKALNKKHFSFEQIIIDKINDEEARVALLKQLQERQLMPMNIIEEDMNGKRTEKAIYPWAIVRYKGRERSVKLLFNTNNRSGEENVNASIENLEYQFTEAFRLLTDTQERRVAFLEGHGELGEAETYDITTALSHYYSVDRGQIAMDASVLDAYEAVIIANPIQAFSREDKFVLDQYLMKGGKLLWLVDGVQMAMDSLTKAEANYGIYNDINVNDMLFRYGVRINPDLIQDMQCALYPVNIAGPGEAARFQPLPWFYAPLLMPNQQHPISKNTSNVKAEFASTIDLVGGDDKLKKTILLRSTAQSRVVKVPMEIDLGESVKNLKVEDFQDGSQVAAVLLEGQFTSLFAHRGVPPGMQNAAAIQKESVPTKVIVIADGDLIRNDVRGYGEEVQVMPLGYDYATNQTLYGNRPFLLNAINYLTDEEGWYTLRQRSVKLRLLDVKEMERRVFYRVLNVALPLLIMLLLAVSLMYLRNRRYKRFKR